MQVLFRYKQLLILIMMIGPYLQSQNTTGAFVSAEEDSFFSVGFNYITDAVFLGRKDSITAPYLFTSLGYHHKSGLYANGHASYLTRANEGRIDLFLVSAGYEKLMEKFYWDISATKYFFNTDSYNVMASIEADITALGRYDLEIVEVGLAASIYFSSNSSTDLVLLPSVSRDFTTTDKRFQVSPSLELQLGSQQFYQEYYTLRGKNNQGSGQGGSFNNNTSSITETIVLQDESFTLMSVELGLPMWYQYKSFIFCLSPYYAIPLNPGTIEINDILEKEELDPSLYLMIGLEYRI